MGSAFSQRACASIFRIFRNQHLPHYLQPGRDRLRDPNRAVRGPTRPIQDEILVRDPDRTRCHGHRLAAGHTRDPYPGHHEEATLVVTVHLGLVRQHPDPVDVPSATAGPRACPGPGPGRTTRAVPDHPVRLDVARLLALSHHRANGAETRVILGLCRDPSLRLVGQLLQHRGEDVVRTVHRRHLVEPREADTPSRCLDLDLARRLVVHLEGEGEGEGVARPIIFNAY